MRPAARCFCGCCKTACSAAVAAPTCCCRALTWARFFRRLRRLGGEIIGGEGVWGLLPSAGAGWQVSGGGAVAAERFEHVTLACPPWEARRLVAGIARLDAAGQRAARCWSAAADGLRFAAIATVYVHADGVRQPQPMLALRSTAEQTAQFVFDRGWLGGPPGLLAFVGSVRAGERPAIERPVPQQARSTLAHRESGAPGAQPPLRLVQTVLEKRATFACTPGLQRPRMQVLPGLRACGDYVQTPSPVYPATLEGAVLSGSAAAAQARPSPAWRR